ncbi:MAG: SDR family oxidoreductase [Oscillospiraceae bacterium]|nr:SDR family oxidoreductase [Oscillospiraceae bacterium]
MKRIVIITGVLGGIGYATAKIFKSSGWDVIGVDRASYVDKDNVIDLFIEKDISETENINDIFNQIKSKGYEHINCLVNNAAVQVAKSILDTSEDEWDLVYRSNIKSVFIAVKYAHEMLKKAKGSIVNVSSIHAFATSRNISAYASSKSALLGFTRSLALEFIEDDIRVNCVAPAAVNTGMLVDGLSRGLEGEDTVDVMMERLGLRHPIKRVGDPHEIGKLIYFLGNNEQSSFLTGQSFVADGGALAQLSTEVY